MYSQQQQQLQLTLEEDIAVGVEDISQRLDGMYQSLLSTTCNVSQREMGSFGGGEMILLPNGRRKAHNWWNKTETRFKLRPRVKRIKFESSFDQVLIKFE